MMKNLKITSILLNGNTTEWVKIKLKNSKDLCWYINQFLLYFFLWSFWIDGHITPVDVSGQLKSPASIICFGFPLFTTGKIISKHTRIVQPWYNYYWCHHKTNIQWKQTTKALPILQSKLG
jgi:hypothetical protein